MARAVRVPTTVQAEEVFEEDGTEMVSSVAATLQWAG
jgi:hypothetical protein